MPSTTDSPRAFGLYRSGITSPEQLRHITVAREDLLDDARSKLLGSMNKSSKQHSLFIGPRGVGKTHLLSLIEQEIKGNPELKERYIIVRFPEESLRLISYVDFLMGICEILQDVLPPGETDKWRELYDQFVEDPDGDRIRDTLEAEIRKTGRDQGRTLLIMLENLDEVLSRQIDSRHAAPKERKGHREAAALRKWFMGDNGCMLIATAPLYFSAISDVNQPFYDFFDVQSIVPLDQEETLELIHRNLEWEEQTRWIEQFGDLKPRILALHEMTGGNPRLVMMLYELITRESVTAVREQFMGLLARITPFYQDRVKALPPQERALLETMARMRRVKKTPAAIAARMRLSPQQTSSLLNRLTKSLYLKAVPNPEDKRSRIYTIREGFFDLWLAMNLSRADRARIPFLVEFFETWYRSMDEREEKRKSLYALLEQPEKTHEAVAALDHLSEVGTPDERAQAKVKLATRLAELGQEEESSRYIAEFQRMELDGLGRWVADHTSQWSSGGIDMYGELETMIACWQTQRSGRLEAFAKQLRKLGGELNYKNYSEARVEFLAESLNHLTDPAMRIDTRLAVASALKRMARWREAEEHLRLAKRESEEDETSPHYSTVLNNLALVLLDTSRLAEAESLLRRAVEIEEQSHGADGQNVAAYLSNLSMLLRATTRLSEAEPLMRRALDMDEQSLGPDHPSVAVRLSNLALLLWDTHRFGEAEPLVRRALEIDEQSHGANHPSVAVRLNNLATLLQGMNRLGEAEPLLRRALEIDERSFGADHPSVAIALSNLAVLLQDAKRPSEAEPLVRRALEIDEQSLGPDHPNVAIRLNNLAMLLKGTDRFSEAEPLMRRHLAIFTLFREANGREHPNMACGVKNYTSLLKEMGLTQDEIEERMKDLMPEPRSSHEG